MRPASPRPVALPPARQLPATLGVMDGSGSAGLVHPFFVTTGEGPDAAQHANEVLLIVDISGSMNDPSPGATSRFAAVKSAISRYVSAMHENSDQIAIVPFESHNVVPTIRSAVFSGHKAEVLAQLNALPAPGPKNNTALFQAVFTGVETMKSQLATLQHDNRDMGEVRPHIIIMTDGKNEVQPGDDPQLLNGPLGLQQAAEQVQTSHIDVVGIGFGDQAAIDAAAMQKLSTRFLYAADADQLLAALHTTRSEQSHTLQMTWLLSEPNRLALAGRDQVWTPQMTLTDGTILNGDAQRVPFPAMTAPPYARLALPAELVALIAVHPPAVSGWSTVLVHLLIFVVVAALLLILWFWVPRLVWADVGTTPAGRWSGDRASARAAAGHTTDRQPVRSAAGVQIRSAAVKAPSGFTAEPESASPLQRSAAQTTHVGPRPETTRTRLNFE